ncbi:Gluconate 5-dehydrogenase [Stutzerimonas frequens]|jgi:NAD(P)-dependent dehydrogenase (short-subunit alcohol dehydrogenase family)|uniref:SDR family oxidoreductase n=1 Tax=Stutzerimonas stutzeri TaxID=316 RepID=A0AA42HAG9_STUST|nr:MULTISPECIES: SDR family oxidoreductase [Pseudomonadaceae]MCH2341965.1 SDR family oxidoreductase [Pseudomonas sp.]MEC7474579.1 SDR family oxidoreductase [Pseudomonadota bacterium]MBH3356338.1 SDR family oxidoreductase [Stutzerimonas stutzeri]MBH3385875.1 SDR family oxidoreductase [Pseudomonas juntendi]MDH0146101.1 SDR family oxidoreductase [Stutzerimonas stutzeri]|tara:strand:- start:4118 stop:4885 length:768 start_codon:yes stop_codon:yes gene_type:complete
MQPPIARLFDLDGRRALVTGASSGLGRHFALTLAAAGAEVAVASRRTEQLRELVADIEAAGGRAQAFALDVTRRQDVCRCLDEVGPLDILVNNAGVSDSRAFLDYDDESWQRILDTNLSGAWIVAQETARRMVAAERGGSLINVTSILASRVAGAVTPYLAAKAGLAQLTRAMALELARYGIRVNALAPGYVMTDLNEEFLRGEAGEKLRARIPNRRFSLPADLDGALLLLASDAGRAMNGAEIVVDGGHLCSSL